MRTAAPFRTEDGALALTLPGGEVRFTTRRGPDLRDWRAPAVRAALGRLAGLPEDRVAQGEQVHAAHVRVVRDPAELAAVEPADGQATALPGVACVVRVADCLPVALVAPEAVAAVHAGWRGLAGGVVEAGVRALRELGASEIRAALGPCARVCCYETGEEVHAAFAHHGAAARRGDHADLPAIATAILCEEGVTETHDSGHCTICDPGFWSHRREGGTAGRQGGLTWRN
ncbi:MAG: polyphenol oxidase family protein [Solirubrobacteraceae bacterium]|nr:polyphenol oxidase family protein [Solirubrobacteraceae bacterium]